MMKKLKYILSSILIVLIIAVTIVIRNMNKKSNNDYVEEKKFLYSTSDEINELILNVCKKNGNWENYYLSKKFRKKYNEKDGYFDKMEFDKVEVQPYNESDYPFAIYPHIVLTQGNKKTAYVYQYKYSDDESDPGLEDIIISYSLQLADEYGNKIDPKSSFIGKMKKENLYDLACGGIFEDNVAVTDNFHKKYPFFLDLFIHYSPLSYNKVEFKEYESDLDNNIAIFEVNSILECKKRKYEVKLVFDDKQYLDDAEVKLVKEEDYRGDKQYITAKVIYQNSNWDNLELTNSFRKKYNNTNGIIEDIDNINIDIEMDSQTVVMNKEYINTFVDLTGNKVSYKFEFVDDEKGWVDDIKITKV